MLIVWCVGGLDDFGVRCYVCFNSVVVVLSLVAEWFWCSGILVV